MRSMTLALGHRRLAIIDLSSSGLQPMTNEDKTLWLVFNGEIYNFLELRAELERVGHIFHSQSDSEVILHAYETWGEDCVHHFVGMWAFALADLKQSRLFCSRDRFGIKPFHYYYDGRRFAFASEIKQLLCFPFIQRQVNERAVYEYLAYEAVDWGEETFFANICKLPQGHNLTLNLADTTLHKTHYYAPQFVLNSQITLPEASQEFRRLLIDSVHLHLRSDVRVGSCLSGGLDSSAIVCLMNQLLKDEGKSDIQHTFSSHFEAEEANELEYMQEVIKTTGVQAHFIYPTSAELLQDMEQLVWHQEEPFGSTSIFAQWSVFKLIHQQQVKVVLDGQGADEQLAGYISLAPYYFLELSAKRQHFQLLWETWRHARLQGKSWLALLPGRGGELARKLPWSKPVAMSSPHIDWIKQDLGERYQSCSGYLANFNIRPFSEAEYLNNVLYQFTFLNNLPPLLRYEDRNSMAFSVESRVPFLDHRLVEFVFSLPSHFKLRDGYTKRVMRDAITGVIPEKIRRRARKMGFATPERHWQQTILQPLIRQALADPRLHPFIIPDKAEAYLTWLETYPNLNFAPWRWLNLSLWLKAYDLA
jgi:asparagine synthase (glutamine-hydrolysing)